MARDLTDRRQVEKLEKAARVQARQDAATVVSLMDTMAGRQYVHRKLESCHVFATTFSTNALQMAFNEGRRNGGLELLVDIMAHCPDQYVLMMREANERAIATERSLSADSGRNADRQSADGADDDDTGQLDLYTDFDRRVQAGSVRLIGAEDGPDEAA